MRQKTSIFFIALLLVTAMGFSFIIGFTKGKASSRSYYRQVTSVTKSPWNTFNGLMPGAGMFKEDPTPIRYQISFSRYVSPSEMEQSLASFIPPLTIDKMYMYIPSLDEAFVIAPATPTSTTSGLANVVKSYLMFKQNRSDISEEIMGGIMKEIGVWAIILDGPSNVIYSWNQSMPNLLREGVLKSDTMYGGESIRDAIRPEDEVPQPL